MATWNGVGQVASVAQLAGIDAYGLIKMIVEAVQTVKRNKETCQKLARRVKMIGDLLQELHEAQLMQHRDTRNPVEQLEETLRRAFMLITTCQDISFMYHCFTGGNQACQLHEVENDIAFYLQIFPLVSHVDSSRTLILHQNRDQPSHIEEYEKESRILKEDPGHAISPRFDGTSETVESRIQEVNNSSADNEENVTGYENLSVQKGNLAISICDAHFNKTRQLRRLKKTQENNRGASISLQTARTAPKLTMATFGVMNRNIS